MSRSYLNHMLSNNSIVIVFSDGLPLGVAAEHPLYRNLRTLVDESRFDEIPGAASEADRIKLHSNGMFYVRDGIVLFSDSEEELPPTLSDRLLQIADAGADVQALVNFWNNLKLNETDESRQDLYAFLEVNGVPITEDGCFIAYKRVKDDWMDHYSGRNDNSPGKTISMDRDKVDPNRENTCSTGLHVAAYKYASGGHGLFTHGRLLNVKVNPKNVVAVPPDYNQEKMRVCEYTVIDEITREYMGGPVYTQQAESEYDYDDYDYDPDIYDDDELDEWESELGMDEPLDDLNVQPTQVGDKVTLTPSKDKRVIIPKALTSGLGMNTGDFLAVFNCSGKCVVAGTTAEKAKTIKTYQVDPHGNIRISNTTLDKVGLANKSSLTAWIENVDSELQIVLAG